MRKYLKVDVNRVLFALTVTWKMFGPNQQFRPTSDFFTPEFANCTFQPIYRQHYRTMPNKGEKSLRQRQPSLKSRFNHEETPLALPKRVKLAVSRQPEAQTEIDVSEHLPIFWKPPKKDKISKSKAATFDVSLWSQVWCLLTTSNLKISRFT